MKIIIVILSALRSFDGLINPRQVLDLKRHLKRCGLCPDLLVQLSTSRDRVLSQGEQRLKCLVWVQIPHIVLPLFWHLVSLAMLVQRDSLAVLILELFNDVHEVNVGFLNIGFQLIHHLESVNCLQMLH